MDLKDLKETIRKTVALARLQFPEAEMSRFLDKTTHIIEYIEKLDKLDTQNVTPTSHAIDVTNAFREDGVETFPNRAKLIENAPEHWKQYIEVPKVIDEN